MKSYIDLRTFFKPEVQRYKIKIKSAMDTWPPLETGGAICMSAVDDNRWAIYLPRRPKSEHLSKWGEEKSCFWLDNFLPGLSLLLLT